MDGVWAKSISKNVVLFLEHFCFGSWTHKNCCSCGIIQDVTVIIDCPQSFDMSLFPEHAGGNSCCVCGMSRHLNNFKVCSQFWATSTTSKSDTPTASNLVHKVPTSCIHWGIWNYFIKWVFLLPSNISQSSTYCGELYMLPEDITFIKQKALGTLESFSSMFLVLDGFG